MRYHVWFTTEKGTPSTAGPSPVYASGLVEAQRKAADTLAELQERNALVGWSTMTVTEA
jgi:hypothetical protein